MTQVKTTKRKTLINFNGLFLMTNNDWNNKDIVPMDEKISKEFYFKNGWIDVPGEYDNVKDAYTSFMQQEKERRAARAEATVTEVAKRNAELLAAWDAIKDLTEISATIDNIRTIINHFNTINWGCWPTLPSLSIGYSMHQYDCEGTQVTAIKLDKPVAAASMYKTSGKRGHLCKYTTLY